jgi:hypothetical protein
MPAPRKLVTRGSLVALILALVIGAVWVLHSPARPPEDPAQAEIKKHEAVRLVKLKDSALAALENRDFNAAEQPLLDLATVGIGEPIGSRNWLINRISVIGTIDEEKDTKAYAEAVERARTALNLDWNIERGDPVRYYLAAKIEFLSQNIGMQIEDLHNGAGRGAEDPLIWHDLYLAERDNKDESIRADGENALKTLHERLPANLYVLVEWMNVQAKRKDLAIVRTLELARQELLPFLADVPADSSISPARAISDASEAAKRSDWNAVGRNVAAIAQVGSVQPAVQGDKRRVNRSLLWRIKTDFSEKFYRERPFDRVLPKESVHVRFRDVELAGPLAELNDVSDARCVDFDSDGRLDIAVLRKSSFEVYGRTTSAGKWTKLAAAAVPAGMFERFLAADLDRDAPAGAPDFVLFGSGGLRVIENRLNSDAKTRSLQTIDSPALAEKTKGAESVVAVDLDDDGALDLVVATKGTGTTSQPRSGVVSVWRNLGRRQFADVTPRSGLTQTPTVARSLVAIDSNHDFDMDVLMAGSGSAPTGVSVLKGAGSGRFHLEPIPSDNSVFQAATALTVLDADANGCLDILTTSPAGIALLQTFSTQPGEVHTLQTETITDFPAERLLVADFDNDGCPEVIGWNRETVRCFHGLGNGRFEPATDALPWNLKAILSADCGDIDADGDIDLVVVTPEAGGGRVHFLENEGGNANNWIDVCLVGGPAASGPPSQNRTTIARIGSTLQLKSGVVCQAQIVTGPVTHFGIGKLNSADVLRVVWPTGVPLNLSQPTKNRVIRVAPPTDGWR